MSIRILESHATSAATSEYLQLSTRIASLPSNLTFARNITTIQTAKHGISTPNAPKRKPQPPTQHFHRSNKHRPNLLRLSRRRHILPHNLGRHRHPHRSLQLSPHHHHSHSLPQHHHADGLPPLPCRHTHNAHPRHGFRLRGRGAVFGEDVRLQGDVPEPFNGGKRTEQGDDAGGGAGTFDRGCGGEF